MDNVATLGRSLTGTPSVSALSFSLPGQKNRPNWIFTNGLLAACGVSVPAGYGLRGMHVGGGSLKVG